MAKHQSGDFAAAEELFQLILKQTPGHANALHLIGLGRLQSGDPGAALDYIERSIATDDGVSSFHNNLSLVLQALRRNDEAITALQRAIDIDPGQPDSQCNLAILLKDAGRLDEADAALTLIFDSHPDHPAALNVQGLVFQARGDLGTAENSLVRATETGNAPIEAFINLADVMRLQGRLDEAEKLLLGFLASVPENADALNVLGATLRDRGDLAQAKDTLNRALGVNPWHVKALLNLGDVLIDLDSPSEAETVYRQIIALGLDSAEVHSGLGDSLRDQSKTAEAEDCYKLALELRPLHADAWYGLGVLYRDMDNLDDAVVAWLKTVEADPDYPEAHFAIASALATTGFASDAVARFRAAHELAPTSAKIHSNLLMAMQYVPDIPRQEIADEHRRWGKAHATARPPRPNIKDSDPDRTLKVGFVSSDFRFHASGFFFLPILEHLNGHKIEAVLYSDVSRPDDVTDQFRTAAASFHEIFMLDDHQLAARIVADDIDILVDMKGHTSGNRLPMFALRPAPVQVSWFDYVDTTGMSAMDSLINDATQIGPADEGFYSETIVRLPDDYICYRPPAYMPDVTDAPALKKGHVTFGCFNTAQKINPTAIEAWCEILDRVPGSRLILSTPELRYPTTRRRMTELLAHGGIGPDRFDLRQGASHEDFVTGYADIDIALDPFPYTGGLNTCEALWMGVPVVTRTGDRFCGRHSTVHLRAAGFPGLVTEDTAAYMDKAVSLAENIPSLNSLR
ncbi:MAG: tetratricopeptide repeat protein, partial [Alphaproteobacteria bacterium]